MGIIDTIKMLAREEAREDVYEEGIQAGIQAGIQVGIERGIEEGLEKGIKQKSVEVVKKLLLTERFTEAEVANSANVTEDFVRNVKRELGK